MSALPLAIVNTGLVTSVGLSAPAACAAIRAGLANPTTTHFLGSDGRWITGHQVALEGAWRGWRRLVKMATLAIAECLEKIPRERWQQVPMLLCVAEPERPGRTDGIDAHVFANIQRELGVEFAPGSLVIASGRISVANALLHARDLLASEPTPYVMIVATDSLLTWPTLQAYDRGQRLLTAQNPNGFTPGEGAGAVLIARSEPGRRLSCDGIGLGNEASHIASEQPLRSNGLAHAINAALADAGCVLSDLDYRIADCSGEQYYFKEAALAVARLMHVRKQEFDLWHPAECIGETGALAGAACIAVAAAACSKEYGPGESLLFHASNDAGERAAVVLRLRTT